MVAVVWRRIWGVMGEGIPAHFLVLRNKDPTASDVNLVFLVETSSAALESVRSAKYFASHSKERAVKNTVRGLFLFPSTLASRVSKFTSSRLSRSTSEIRIPVAINISTNALKQ